MRIPKKTIFDIFFTLVCTDDVVNLYIYISIYTFFRMEVVH